MSVINQVLLDLERRRASGAERSALPDHVRALPETARTPRWGWVAGSGITAIAVIAASWPLLSGFDWTRLRAAASPVPAPVAATPIKSPAVTAAGAATGAVPLREPAAATQPDAPASRLSLELSTVPDAVERSVMESQPLLPAASVIGRAETERAARSDAAAERPERIKTPAVVAAAKPAASAPAPRPEIQKEVKQPAPRDLAENEHRKATTLLHQGRRSEAQEGFQAALNLFPGHHGARQALVGLLLDGKQYGEAERVLQEGLALAPAQTGFAMTLARLQVDRGDAAQASATLKKGLEHAQGSADYLAFLAALLQRQGRHEEAIEQFQAALRMRPAAGVWWLGLGISLQAANRGAEAQEAYRRARATNSLAPDLAAFAEQRLRQLQ